MSTELAAGLPNARLVVLPGCAHVPQLQAPELFLSSIARSSTHVDRIAGRAAGVRTCRAFVAG